MCIRYVHDDLTYVYIYIYSIIFTYIHHVNVQADVYYAGITCSNMLRDAGIFVKITASSSVDIFSTQGAYMYIYVCIYICIYIYVIDMKQLGCCCFLFFNHFVSVLCYNVLL